ncbi:MAG: beta-propeller fold lactonase family protein [Methylophilaceae bacterium]|nr:beta-propeller fold lactonase family protein [Methylophilaceae bacterium]
MAFVHAADRGLAYVSEQYGGVMVVDLNSMRAVAEIDVQGLGARGLGLTDDGKLLIVAVRENGSVSVIDTSTRRVIKQIAVGKNPEFVRVRGHFAFVSYEPSATGSAPSKTGTTKNDDHDDDVIPARIGVIDLNLGKKVREIVAGAETEGIEFSADGRRLVVTNEADNTVTVHDITSGELLKTINTQHYGNRPRGIKLSPNGQRYVVSLEFGNKLMVMNQAFEVVATVDTADTPYGVAFDKSGERIMVATNKAKLLQVFDSKTLAKIKDIPTGNRCWHFSFTPDGQDILLACGKSDALLVIDANNFASRPSIANNKQVWGVVTYPKAMGSLENGR